MLKPLAAICLAALLTSAHAQPNQRVTLSTQGGAAFSLEDLEVILARLTQEGAEIHAVELRGPRLRLDLDLPAMETLSPLLRPARLGFHPVVGVLADPPSGIERSWSGWRGADHEALRAFLEQQPGVAAVMFSALAKEGDLYEAYPLGAAFLTNADVAEAMIIYNEQLSTIDISLQLHPEGAARLSDHTTAHVQEALAIVLDDVVLSAPIIRERIAGGRASISLGNGAKDEEAARLARDLRMRPLLNARLEVVEQLR